MNSDKSQKSQIKSKRKIVALFRQFTEWANSIGNTCSFYLSLSFLIYGVFELTVQPLKGTGSDTADA